MGNSVSHSHHKTRRRFEPNLQNKRYWVPSLRRAITLTVSTKAIKTIDRIGIESAISQALSNGFISASDLEPNSSNPRKAG
jgi:large subunit ribosomal protein L28